MIAIRDRVRFVETDMMGVVHHANYLRWFEMWNFYISHALL